MTKLYAFLICGSAFLFFSNETVFSCQMPDECGTRPSTDNRLNVDKITLPPLVITSTTNTRDENKLYRIHVTCSVSTAPNPNWGVFYHEVETGAHSIAFINSGYPTSFAALASSDFVNLIPLYSFVGGSSAREIQRQIVCPRTFIMSGRDFVYLSATAKYGYATESTILTRGLFAIASVVLPLGPLFTQNVADHMKNDWAGLPNSVKAYNDFISTASTAGLTLGDELKPGKYVITTAFSRVVITVSPTTSILDQQDRLIRLNFDSIVVRDAVKAISASQNMRQTCNQIARSLELKNLASKDIHYVLANSLHLAGVSTSSVVGCLGSDYGPAVMRSGFWRGTRIPDQEFPAAGEADQPNYVANQGRFITYAQMLNAYLSGTSNAAENLFGADSVFSNETGFLGGVLPASLSGREGSIPAQMRVSGLVGVNCVRAEIANHPNPAAFVIAGYATDVQRPSFALRVYVDRYRANRITKIVLTHAEIYESGFANCNNPRLLRTARLQSNTRIVRQEAAPSLFNLFAWASPHRNWN